MAARIRVQNTGAGHAFPTGSPFSAVELSVALVRGDSDERVGEKLQRFGRTLSEAPPWHTTSDTRIPVGGEQTVEYSEGLPLEATAGRWFLTVSMRRIARDGSAGPSFLEQRLPLMVD